MEVPKSTRNEIVAAPGGLLRTKRLDGITVTELAERLARKNRE